MILDATLVAVALASAKLTRPFLSSLPFAKDINKPTVPIPLYPLFIIIWVSIFLILSIYDGRRNYKIVDELTSVTIGSLLAGVSLAGLLYLSYRDVSRLLFLVFALQAYVSLIVWRLAVRLVSHKGTRDPRLLRRVLIVGAGPVGRELQGQIERLPYLNLNVVGFLDDDPDKRAFHQDILGSIKDAPRILSLIPVDDIVIALPRRAHEEVSRLVAKLHNYPVKVWVIPDYFHLALHKAAVDEFAGIPMLDLRAPALNDYQRLVKRLFDLAVGTILQILVLPIMIAIAIAIKIDSRGPILFKQRRVGENGRLFWMYKFRSMVMDADQQLEKFIKRDSDGNIIHKTPDDPRITRLGRFLRRTSLDELPQLFNVLKGDMSLVGPRPEMPLLVEQYKPWQRRRFAIPQGITGWWQVNGRSNKPMHLHTEDDLYYVQNYSLLLDLQILIKTAWVVLRGKGAY
ncbi:MAG: sugar transferase [Anaerolineales bacterium]|jgi:exopolysaccharide biosynthesis polyprenyl glycosylphosphotransferase